MAHLDNDELPEEIQNPPHEPLPIATELPLEEPAVHLPTKPKIPTLHALLGEPPRQLPVFHQEAPPVHPSRQLLFSLPEVPLLNQNTSYSYLENYSQHQEENVFILTSKCPRDPTVARQLSQLPCRHITATLQPVPLASIWQ